jgi:hypothetical protein
MDELPAAEKLPTIISTATTSETSAIPVAPITYFLSFYACNPIIYSLFRY